MAVSRDGDTDDAREEARDEARDDVRDDAWDDGLDSEPEQEVVHTAYHQGQQTMQYNETQLGSIILLLNRGQKEIGCRAGQARNVPSRRKIPVAGATGTSAATGFVLLCTPVMP